MIEGLHVDVTGQEMKRLYEGRAEYHQKKVAFYERQVAQHEEMERELGPEEREIAKTSNASPRRQADTKLQEHSNLVTYYKFAAEHVCLSETYRLSKQDLYSLGIAPSGY